MDNNLELKMYEEIHDAIAEHRLEPGTKLIEEVLAEIFTISRARVRKVLQRLARENIVQLKQNRGAFVRRPTIEEAKDVLEARCAIELYLIKEACVRITKDDIKQLYKVVEKEQKAISSNNDAQRMRLSGEFHITLAKCANNPILIEFLSTLISRCYLILATYERSNKRSCPDHELIVKSLEVKDAAVAYALLKEHFAHIENELDLNDKNIEKKNLKQIFMKTN